MVEALDDNWWENSTETSHDSDAENKVEEKASFSEDFIPIEDGKKTLNSEKSSNKRKKKRKKPDLEEDKKRKKADSEVPSKRKKTDSGTEMDTASTVKTDKKRKRKTITDILADKKDKALCSEDLIDAINNKYKDKLTGLEWDEIKIDDTNFSTCNDTSHTANSLLKTLLPKWKKLKEKSTKEPGSPMVLIICSSAIRAADMTRLIADFKGENCKVMKLFAKHIKLDEQIKQLKKTPFHIGVGTPNRLTALLDNGCLKLEELHSIVLDWSWRDCKQKRIVDIPQVKDDLFCLLKQHLIPCVKKQTRTRFSLL